MTDSQHVALTKQAKIIIDGSHIPSADKALLVGRIPFVAESMLAMFVQVCNEDPFSVDAIIKNLKSKLDAQGNLRRLHEIVKQERREMEDALLVG